MKQMKFLAGLILVVAFLEVSYTQDSAILSIDRIFGSREFSMKGYGPTQWLDSGNAFTSLEQSPDGDGKNLVKYASSSMQRTVLVTAEELIAPGKNYPLQIESYTWNPSEDKLLIFTNSSRVWRANTKGDYWIFDMTSRKLTQVGRQFASSSLMFAKFAPTGNRIAYVSSFNLYVEDLVSGKVKQLAYDGDGKIINGTFDWVYEEEFSCRDGFRWSPDGKNIAYWQVDASDTKEFYMINNTDSVYSKLIPIQYPKVGEPPSACKIGIVNLEGNTNWAMIPGHPREHYLPRMQWIDADKVLIQQLNRKQNHYKMYLSSLQSESPQLLYEEISETWIDIDHPDLTMSFTVTDLPVIEQGSAVLRSSEKDGWRHLFSIDLITGEEKLITKGDYDIARYYSVRDDYIFINASPSNSTERYLYRVKLDGTGNMNRLTPEVFEGVNRYNISPNGKYAIHDHSSVNDPRTIRIINLPRHQIIETVQDNAEFISQISKLKWPEIEFYRARGNYGWPAF
jgi:dipeptidyl-peptidase-4